MRRRPEDKQWYACPSRRQIIPLCTRFVNQESSELATQQVMIWLDGSFMKRGKPGENKMEHIVRGFCPKCFDERELEKVETFEDMEVRGETFNVQASYFKCVECG